MYISRNANSCILYPLIEHTYMSKLRPFGEDCWFDISPEMLTPYLHYKLDFNVIFSWYGMHYD